MTALLLALAALYALRVHLKRLIIKDEITGEPYLTRWHLIKCKPFRVFLHHIHRPDKDRHVHNHPWPRAFAFVLRGGYTEEVLSWSRRAKRHYHYVYSHSSGQSSTIAFRPDNYHRIVSTRPNTWTLFFAGRRSRDWGFLKDGKHVPCREYLGLAPDHDFGD